MKTDKAVYLYLYVKTQYGLTDITNSVFESHQDSIKKAQETMRQEKDFYWKLIKKCHWQGISKNSYAVIDIYINILGIVPDSAKS